MTAFIAAALVLIAAYFVQMRIFRRHVFDDLTFTEKLDETEVTVGDDIYLYEEITNDKGLPIPYLKATSTLPDGLVFRLTEISGAQDRKGRVVMDRFTPTVDSMFVVKGHQRITRRWRITCMKRGVYTLGGALVVSNDLIGFNPVSKQIDPPTGKSASVTVLPAPVDLEREFTSSRYFSGDVVVEKSLLSDPLLRAGVRDYTPGDPMRRINWKSTAAHGRLLVNVEEKVQKLQANIIVNMCSHMIEPDPEIPGAPEFIEYNITVAATLIGRFAAENVPVRLIANTPPETIHSDFTAGEDETGKKILVTPPFSGKYGVLDAMRVLAELKMLYSMPTEKLFDYILEEPGIFAESGNIVVVTAVFDGRMLVFHREMAKRGIDVIFYLTTTGRVYADIPPEVRIFYRTWSDSLKAGDMS